MIRLLFATAKDSWLNARRDAASEDADWRLRVGIGILFWLKGARPCPMYKRKRVPRGGTHVTLFTPIYRGKPGYIAIATIKTAPVTTPIHISSVGALPVVEVEGVEVATGVDVPTRSEGVVANDCSELVEMDVFVDPVLVKIVVDAMEFVEPETDVGVGPEFPVVVASPENWSTFPRQGRGSYN